MLKIIEKSIPTSEALIIKHQQSLENVLADKSLGFHQLPERTVLWDSCKVKGGELRAKFDHLVVLGIGGSALGGRVIFEALPNSSRTISFWDNVDPLLIDRELLKLQKLPGLTKVGFVAISKSGNTIETLTQCDYISQFYTKHQLNFISHLSVITEPRENPLSSMAKQNQIQPLDVPLDVGGRFSVLSPVGMLPAAFLGLNLDKFRKGAAKALDAKPSIAEFAAQSSMSFERQEWITMFMSYSPLLKEFGAWVQQLWSESLAKKIDRKNQTAPRASTPVPCVGVTDQHSILQQIVEGFRDKFVVFLRNTHSESSGAVLEKSLFEGLSLIKGRTLGQLLGAEAKATQMGLTQEKVSNLTLMIENLDEESLGFLFMYFELVVATIGENMNINTFNQPGVEIGKIITKKLLEQR